MSGKNCNPLNSSLFKVYTVYDAIYPVGADIDYSFSEQAIIKLVSLSFVLTTDANAADRLVSIVMDKAGTTHYLTCVGASQPANTAKRYHFMIGGGLSVIPNPLCYHGPLPDSPLFHYADKLQTVINNKQAGDRISLINYIFQYQPTRAQL